MDSTLHQGIGRGVDPQWALTIPGYVPLPPQLAAEVEATIPGPALQTCGLREDGALTEPAEFHKWSRVTAFEEEFEKLQTQFHTLKNASMAEQQTVSPQKRRRLCPGIRHRSCFAYWAKGPG